MTMDTRRCIAGLGLVINIMVSSGCVAPVLLLGAGAGAGAGTVAYIRGEWIQTYPAQFEQVWPATQTAAQDLHLNVTEVQKTGMVGTLRGTRADGTAVTLRVTPVSGGLTEVRIRVGWFGNREISDTIGNEIALRLKTTAG